MNDKVSNAYARAYYDTHLRENEEEYEEDRWHRTPEREFDYRQTRYSLRRGLEGHYRTAVEIGPGDGVWSRVIRMHTDALHLIEQSEEMLARARRRLSDLSNVSYEHSDIVSAKAGQYDLIISIRCFEYLEDKDAALRKCAALAAPRAQIILITKNPRFLGASRAHAKRLHTGQVARTEMCALLRAHGFDVQYVYPAVFRLKARYAPFRIFFGMLHRLTVWARSGAVIPFAEYVTESYVYIAQKNN